MFASYRSPNSLSKKMMRVIFSIYLFVTCLITSMQFLTEYLKTQNSISYELKQLQETVQGPVSTSLWQYDQTQLGVLVDGLIKMPVIEGVDVFDKHGKSMISKRSYTQASLPLSIFETKSELYWTLNGTRVFLGTLVLYSSSEVVLDRVLFGFFLIAITAMIKLSILFGLFIWAFDRYLARPLKELMQQVNEVQSSKNVRKRINLSHIENNELSQLQDHMNTMLFSMERDRERLLEDEKSKRDWLEEAVTKRTKDLQVLNEKLKTLATRDSLTGILNRGSF
ncbi:MAG: methyl-accepting chemotaxis protein, partial [Pseudoalteromonas tetraodonis]